MKIKIQFIFLSLFCLTFSELSSQVVINEICSANDFVTDQFGEAEDWIEIKNTGTEAVLLSTFYLSDDANDIFKWQLPNEVINPGEFRLFFSESENSSDEHFNFGISSQGEELHFSRLVLGTFQTITVPQLSPNHSYGKSSSSDDYFYFSDLTPNSENSTDEKIGYSEPFEIPLEGGFFEEPLTIDFSGLCPLGDIHFTTDGKFPTDNDEVISGELEVSETHVVKAVCIEQDRLPSNTSKETYLINEDFRIPVISLSVDHDTLFHEDLGIYMLGPNADPDFPHFGANYWSGKQVKVSFEYFENGQKEIDQEIDLTIHGGKSSRNKPQRTLRLTARSKYGHDFMEHTFFEEKPHVDKFKHLILRNSGSDFLKSNFRDGYWHQVALWEDLDFEVFGFQPAVVLINGEYWGVMNIRERVSEYYIAHEREISIDSLLVTEKELEPFIGDTIHFHNFKEFAINEDLSIPEKYQVIQDQLDIKSYMDYFCTEIYAGNLDWPANNIKYWKEGPSEGKWRYIMFDLDTTMKLFAYIPYDLDMFDFIFVDKAWSVNSKLYVALLENPEFKRQFINRLADLMNTSFTAENLQNHLNTLKDEFDLEVEDHYDRWNGSRNKYISETDTIIPEFFTARAAFVKEHVISHFHPYATQNIKFEVYPPNAGEIGINTIQPNMPFEGDYFSGNAIDLKALPNDGQEFVRWHWKPNSSDTLSVLENPELEEIQHDFLQGGTLTAIFKDDNTSNLVVIGSPGAGGLIDFIFESESDKDSYATVSDLQGKKISTAFNFTNGSGPNKHQFTLPDAVSGVYILTVHQGSKSYSVKFWLN